MWSMSPVASQSLLTRAADDRPSSPLCGGVVGGSLRGRGMWNPGSCCATGSGEEKRVLRYVLERLRYLLIALVAVALVLPIRASVQTDAGAFMIQNVRIFHGVRVLPETTIIVRDGRIADIRAQAPGAKEPRSLTEPARPWSQD
jgi:hypothetical protein